jgi:hypothetical protein
MSLEILNSVEFPTVWMMARSVETAATVVMKNNYNYCF